MARKLPPLHLLNLFEAAARNCSFKKASEELHLTPSAISHQIKTLEEHLDITLFKRLTRGVELTPAGKSYLSVVQDVFNRLDQGTTSLKQRFANPCLRLSTFPSLAANIVIPKLAQFQAEFDDLELRIETGLNLVDLRYDDYDLAIRLGTGNWEGVESEKLFNIKVSPVCSPKFAQKYQLKSLEQIKNVPLIHNSSMPDSWPRWCQTIGISQVKSSSKINLGSYEAVIQAATQGLGLALSALPLEHSLIESGSLVRPFDIITDYELSCYAVFRHQDKQRKDIRAFIDWIKGLEELNCWVNDIHS